MNILPHANDAGQIKQFSEYNIPADWRFVPIRKGTKAPIGTGWQNNPFTWSECPKPGDCYQGQAVGAVGILFGHGGIVGLDFDGASVDRMLADWGVSLPDTTVISSGRPGHSLKLFRIPEAYWERVQTAKYQTGTVVQEYGKEVHEQLELRWRGSQSLVYGTHPETGNQYKVLNWVFPLPELPAELLYRMLKPDERNHRPPEGHNNTDQEWAREYLEFIDPNPLDWYTWRDCLFACHAAGLSEAEVRAWSAKSAKHTDRGFDQVWRYIKGRPGIGLGTLGWLAKQGGWEPKAKALKNEAAEVTQELVDQVLAESQARFDIYRLIPTELANAITLKAKTFELPPETLLTVFLTVASSLVPHKLSLGDEYTIPGILWLGLVGESGTGKTPVINTFTKPLSKFQREAYERYELAMESYRQALEDKEIKDKPSPPNRRFYYLQDFTWEAISAALKARNHCLIYSDELAGFVLGQNQYKARGGNDRQRWLTAYDGGAIDVLRTSKNLHIPDVSLSVLGGIQPSVLQRLISGDGATVDGFWARFIWVEIPSRRLPCPIDSPSVNLSELLAGVYERLDQRAGVSSTFRLCPQGKRLWAAWWDEVEALKDAEVNPFLRSIYPKALERAGRIALVAHCVNSAFRNASPGEVIPPKTLEWAIAFVRWTLHQARMVYGDCGHCESPEAQRIARFVQKFQGKIVDGRRVNAWWTGNKKPLAKECRQWLANLVALGYAEVVTGTPDKPDFAVKILGAKVHNPQKSHYDGDTSAPTPGAFLGAKVHLPNSDTENAPDVPGNAPTRGAPEMPTGSQFQGNAPNAPDFRDEGSDGFPFVQRPEGEDDRGLNGLHRSPPETTTASQFQPLSGSCNGCNAPWESENRYNEKPSVTPALQEPLQAAGGTVPNAVYWRKQRYQVQGDINLDGRECYLVDGGLQAPKSECIPAGDLDIFATWNGDIPDWQPTSSPKPWQELRRFSFDIETTGLNPNTDRVIAIAGGGPGIGAFVAADPDEYQTLKQFMDALQAVKPDILIGYNCYKFDLPFLIKRCKKHGIQHPFTISDKPKRLTQAVVAGKPLEVWPIYAKDRQVSVIDLYPLVVAHDNVTAQLESHTLKQAALGFGLRKSPRLELTASEIHQLWETYLKEGIRDPLEKILVYLNFDLEDTQLLAEFLLPQYYYQKILLPDLSLQQLTLTGTATKWNIVLKTHYRLEPEPDPQVPVEGGLMVVNPGLYRHCAKIDVSSLYPSIMLNYGVWTRKDKDRYGLGILKYLTRQRLELKRRAKAGDTEASLMSGALKIFINSAYGFLGTPGMPFNDYQEFAKVPAYGREILKFMLNYMETNNAVIVEADTDGIIFSHPQPEALRDSLQKELPDGINIELEWTNTHVYCAKKKSYILFHPDGTIKANGIYKKRDKTKLEKIYPVEYLKRFLEGGLSEAEEYHQELEKSLLSGNHPISELTITRSIRANEKALLKLGKTGDTITFYQGEGGATISGNYSPRYYIDKVSEIRTEILSVVRKN